MIAERKYFEFKGRCLIEKLIVDGPCRIPVDFPDEACYLFLREGALVINAADAKLSLTPKDGMALNCGNYFADFVSGLSAGRSEIFTIHLHTDVLQEIFQHEIPSFLKNNSPVHLSVVTVSNVSMERFFESMLFYFDNSAVVSDEILLLKVKELILLLVRSGHAKTVHELTSALFTRKSIAVSDVVAAHIYDDLSVVELARLSGLSVSAFKLEFKRMFGESPAGYIRKRKIEHVRDLLRVSNYSISEIAYRVGFRELSHFSKSFQALSGTSPTGFRKQFKLQ